MEKTAIIDLDGTLVDVTSIRYLVEGKKKNFDAFHLRSEFCQPNQAIKKLTNKLHDFGFTIIIFSGRVSKYTDLSKKWLTSNSVHFDEIHLRPNNDFRSDVEIKREMFNSLQTKSVLIAVDDRQELRNLWRELSIPFVLDPQDLDLKSTLEAVHKL